jgi:kinesin family protein 11
VNTKCVRRGSRDHVASVRVFHRLSFQRSSVRQSPFPTDAMSSFPRKGAASQRNRPPQAASASSRPGSRQGAALSHRPPSRSTISSPPLSASASSSSRSREDREACIQVVVRCRYALYLFLSLSLSLSPIANRSLFCRGATTAELSENPEKAVSTCETRGTEVNIASVPQPPVAAPLSLGPSLAPDRPSPSAPTKTYNFDHVFGPDADQGMLYNDVVAPILDEVLLGYNCTIFAYGQTGTGKTFVFYWWLDYCLCSLTWYVCHRYTMSGDLTPTLGTFSPEAGVIPRTLHRLFHILETDHADFAVRVSFVELYNEELRDLNTPGDSVPMTNDANGGGLKIFDETTSKGRNVVIQGVEETPIASAADGVRVLTRGSQRRQIAATKCNEHSSRSHSIFSITVHIKEIGSKGEDLLKVGKMNLVDLAGSENVGRSGAEKGRAREAGMINQSLLTLGRVINGLVDRSPHIPYRSVFSFPFVLLYCFY